MTTTTAVLAARPSYAHAAEHLPDGLVVAREDGLVVLVNSATTAITGIERSALLGRDVRTALPFSDTTGRDWWGLTDPYGGLATRTGHRERLLVLPGGGEALVTARYVRAGRSRPVDRLVLQLRGTEARRRSENDHAGLISTVAHELRSPLTSVKGFTSTLLRKWERFTDDQKRLMLQTVEADADRVTRLITELLDISRMDAGRLEVRRQVVDVEDAVRGQVRRMVATGEPESRFVVRTPGPGETPLPELWADPDRVEQVLSNLVGNAVRHGAGTVTVTVSASTDPALAGPGPAAAPSPAAPSPAAPEPAAPEATGVELLVEDEGEGIDEEHLTMVFTKFWRGDRRGGTGLGLYVVRGLVEAHGGRISIGRSAAGGARFKVLLPSAVPGFAAGCETP